LLLVPTAGVGVAVGSGEGVGVSEGTVVGVSVGLGVLLGITVARDTSVSVGKIVGDVLPPQLTSETLTSRIKTIERIDFCVM